MDLTDVTRPGASAPDGYAPLELTPERWDDVIDVDEWAFMGPWLPEQRAAHKDAFPWERGNGMIVSDARYGTPGTLVAMRGSFPLQMVVPGGDRVETSGLTWVGVHPAHRRRGILRSMMSDHFEHALERGEYISTLFAAEPQIYQRFGYGLAARHARATFSRGAELRDVPGATDLSVRLERLDFDDHAALIADVQRKVTRPGAMVRDNPALARELFSSDVDDRPTEERYKIAIVSDPSGEPLAFALFKRKSKWEGAIVEGSVTVHEFATTTGAAARRLWGVLFDLDLTREIVVESMPLDDRLMLLATDPRSPKATIEDDLWLRILDVRRALEARMYTRHMSLVIHVTDAQLPANDGRWRIVTEPRALTAFDSLDGAGAVATGGGLYSARVTKEIDSGDDSAPADLHLGIQELSAAYLGGVTIKSLTDAGLIEERTPGASLLLSAAMQALQAPMSSFHF